MPSYNRNRYNPYLFQTLGFTHIPDAAQPETPLKLFGATVMALANVESLWSLFQRLIARDPTCDSFVKIARTCANQRRFSRGCVEALVLLLIRSGVIHVRRYADKPCADLDHLLRDDRVYPQFVNDLRRGYVLVSQLDPQACSAWQANIEVEPSTLVNVIIDSGLPMQLEQFDVHRASLTLGSLVIVLGTMLRITPAYHLLALALALLSKQHDICKEDIISLQNLLRHDHIVDIAGKLNVETGRLIDILAKEVESLCLAIKTLKSLHESRLGLDTLRTIMMRCGVSAETLDPILLLEDVRVLAVPNDVVGQEVEVCLSRCG